MKRTALPLLLLPALAQAATIYVSPAGAGDGSSADSPAALSSAVLLAAGAGDTILAADGTYELTETLALANSSGGALVFEGASRGGVVLTLAEGAAAPVVAVGAGTLRNATIRDVSSTAASLLTLSSGSLDSCTVSNCTATGSGNYVVYASAKAVVTNCLFAACSSGSILWDNARNGAAVYDTVVRGCSGASGNGYGQCMRGWNTAFRCTVDGFRVTGEEAFIYTSLYDSFVGGVTGKVVREISAYNCTFAQNRGAMKHGSAEKYYNCLFYDNRASANAGAAFAEIGGSLYNCWLEEGVTGGTRSACLTGTDPMMNADGTLVAGSPCIDTGNNSYLSSYQDAKRPTDLFGNARTYNGTIDIGCFEKNGYTDGEAFFSLDATAVSATAGDTVSCAFQYRADAGVTVSVSLDFGDGSAATTLTFPAAGGSAPEAGTSTHVYAVGGAYDVTATVSFSDGADGVSATVAGKFLVQNAVAGDVYVSMTGSDAADGLTPATAKATVASAATAVYPGYKVVIKAGTYDVAFETTIAKAVEIRGESRDAVILAGATDSRLFTLDNASAVLRDVTIRGVTNNVQSGGGLVTLTKGTLANVLFDRCRTPSVPLVYLGDQATAIVANCAFSACYAKQMADSSNTNPLVSDTTFAGCTGTDHGGMVRRANVYRCRFENNTASQSVVIYSTCYDSLFAGNKGLVVRGGHTYNCTIVDNTGKPFNESKNHYNDIVWGNTGAADAGSLYYCLVDNANAANLKTGNITTATDVGLKAGFVPKSSSSAIGAARYRNDAGTAVDATAFPNADRRVTDLAGAPRVRNKADMWLDIGCLQGILGGTVLIVK
ncbi:MAG: hypothetical protein II839_00170 [Kiritimatiellae bacterium]|nr:hypothetical protein [Kiritimatiellia bacterium]